MLILIAILLALNWMAEDKNKHEQRREHFKESIASRTKEDTGIEQKLQELRRKYDFLGKDVQVLQEEDEKPSVSCCTRREKLLGKVGEKARKINRDAEDFYNLTKQINAKLGIRSPSTEVAVDHVEHIVHKNKKLGGH
jgi:hypothetical protein